MEFRISRMIRTSPSLPAPAFAKNCWNHYGERSGESIHLRSGFRSVEVNAFGNIHNLNCAQNEKDFAGHIWDRRDSAGRMGACVTVVVPWFLDEFGRTGDWRPLAWWVHDHLPYHHMMFFPKLAAFNLTWRQEPERLIYSHANPKGWLTKPGMPGHSGSHADRYPGFPPLR